MNEPDNFLARWSRRKREAVETARVELEQVKPAAPSSPAAAEQQAAEDKAKAKPAAAAAPEFDLAGLPPLESIAAATDVRPFLRPGVPAELSRAALRRAWAADPSIRDFVGLAEYAWDFTAPDAMPGFGDLPMDLDVRKMVAEVFGEAAKEMAAEPRASAPPGQPDAILEQSGGQAMGPEQPEFAAPSSPPSADGAQDQIVHRKDFIAPQQRTAEDQTANRKVSRSHGGALPQ